MKNLLLLFLLFALVLPVVGQTDSVAVKKKYAFNNQFEFDVEFVAVGFGYNHRIYKNWFLGFNLGFGVAYRLGVLPEIAHLSVIIQHKNLKNSISYLINPSIAAYSNLNFDGPEGGIVTGIDFGFYYGKKTQIGVKTLVGVIIQSNPSSNGGGIAASLLVLKIPIRW